MEKEKGHQLNPRRKNGDTKSFLIEMEGIPSQHMENRRGYQVD
jgi:hypothetical protein